MTLETVNTFLKENAIYTVDPLTGVPYTVAMPLRLRILCLPTLYGAVCRWMGMGTADVVYRLIPCVTLLLGYAAYGRLGAVIFGEDGTKRKTFLLIVGILFCAGAYMPGMDGFAVLEHIRGESCETPVIFLTALGAVAACDAVERTCGVRPQIKWTNDLVLNGKKLSGTLTELSLEGESGALQYAVIGIGVNCNNTLEDFPPELRDMATSLYLETGKRVQRAVLAAALIEELDKLYAALQSGDTASYLTAYRRDCLTLGREVQLLWQNVKEKVTALDVDEQFGLVVRHEDGRVETIRTGEVSVRGLYGYVE